MTEPRRFWIVMVIKRFDAIEFDSGIVAGLRTPEEPYSYAPVFESLEAAEKWNEGRHAILPVRAND